MILTKICSAKLEPFDKCIVENLELSFSKNTNVDAFSLSTIKNIEELSNKLIAMEKDSGLDGFLIQASNNAGIYDVHTLQIKCGELGKTLKFGTDSSRDASVYFTAIIKNAEKGWKNLFLELKVFYYFKHHLIFLLLETIC